MSRRRRDEGPEVEWNFFAFPPLFTFALGALVGIFLAIFFGYLAFLAALFGTSFGVAHIISRWVRTRGAYRQVQRAEEEERTRRAVAREQANLQPTEAGTPQRRRRRRRRRE